MLFDLDPLFVSRDDLDEIGSIKYIVKKERKKNYLSCAKNNEKAFNER